MKKRSWKADEMEMSINLKATRTAYVFSVLALLGYCLTYYIIESDFPFIPFVIMCAQLIVFFAVKLVLTKHLADVQNSDINQDEE